MASAQGAFAHTDLVQVTNLSRSLQKLKNSGYWVLGADLQGQDYRDYFEQKANLVLVLGSEGQGLSALVQRHCDALIKIPGIAQGLDSLNVSVAGGILLAAFSA